MISFGGKKYGSSEAPEEAKESDAGPSGEAESLSGMASKKAAGRIAALLGADVDAGALDKALRAHYEACH